MKVMLLVSGGYAGTAHMKFPVTVEAQDPSLPVQNGVVQLALSMGATLNGVDVPLAALIAVGYREEHKKADVLFSGGIASDTALYFNRDEFELVEEA
jgi:hypothetical protein